MSQFDNDQAFKDAIENPPMPDWPTYAGKRVDAATLADYYQVQMEKYIPTLWTDEAILQILRWAAANKPRLDVMQKALNEINALRNDVVGSQRAGWSSLVYPLVAILEEAGFEGEGYDVAHERILTWNTEIKRLNAELDSIRNPSDETVERVARALTVESDDIDVPEFFAATVHDVKAVLRALGKVE